MAVPEGSKLGKMARPRADSMFFCQFGIRDDVFLAIVSGRLSFDAKNGIPDEPFLGFPDGDPGKPSPEWDCHVVDPAGVGFKALLINYLTCSCQIIDQKGPKTLTIPI